MTSRRTWKCPDETTLAGYADQRDTPDSRRKVLGHLADCAYCRGQVAFLAKVEEQPPVDAPAGLIVRARQLVERRQPFLSWGFRWGAVAAGVACLAVAANLWVLQPPSTAPESVPVRRQATAPQSVSTPSTTPVPAPTERAVRGGQPAAAPEPVFPRPDATVARQDLEFRWTGVAAALYYEVRVVTADGDVVFEGKATATVLRVPPSISLAAGQKYFVWIGAHLPEGKTVQSRASAFTIKNE